MQEQLISSKQSYSCTYLLAHHGGLFHHHCIQSPIRVPTTDHSIIQHISARLNNLPGEASIVWLQKAVRDPLLGARLLVLTVECKPVPFPLTGCWALQVDAVVQTVLKGTTTLQVNQMRSIYISIAINGLSTLPDIFCFVGVRFQCHSPTCPPQSLVEPNKHPFKLQH